MNHASISQGQLLLQYLLALDAPEPKLPESAPIRVMPVRPEPNPNTRRRAQE